MPLSGALDGVELVFDGAPCGHTLRKPAEWFRRVGVVRCPTCKCNYRISYAAKLKLFDDTLRQMKTR